MKITDEMIRVALLAFQSGDMDWSSQDEELMRFALEEAFSTIPKPKPVAHLVWLQGRRSADELEDYYEVARPGDKSVDGSEPFPVYAALTAALAVQTQQGVEVKKLEWVQDGVGHWKAPAITGSYHIVSEGDVFHLRLSWSFLINDHTCKDIAEAKAAAQSDYETRIRAALSCAPSGKDVIEACPDCGRPKAKTVEDVARGNCPKWWAIRDSMADQDCERHASLARSALVDVPTVESEPVALIEREVLAELQKHWNATGTVCSPLFKSKFGDKAPLYTHPPLSTRKGSAGDGAATGTTGNADGR